jgi:hypothetical protein
MTFDTIDLGGSGVEGVLSLSEDQAQELIDAGLNFAANDEITLDVDQEVTGTHLSTSLKDLQKLGVDAVSVGMGVDFDNNPDTVNGINLDLGGAQGLDLGLGALPMFGDTDGTPGLSPEEDAALHVTLNVDSADFSSIVGAASSLSYAGIDSLELADVQNESQLENLLNDTASLEALQNAHLDLGLNLGNGHQIDVAAFSIDSDNQITLNASPESTGTHLSTSLKDLQKLGVDAVQASAGPLSLYLGEGTDALSGSNLPKFAGIADVTLNLAPGQQLTEIKDLSATLKASGIDYVSMDWADVLQGDEDAINMVMGAGIDFKMANAMQLNVEDPTAEALMHLDTLLQYLLNEVGSSYSLSPDIGMGDLVNEGIDIGVNFSQLFKSPFVTIGDDLAAALSEAGMLYALPDAGVQIDAGTANHLQTSLKAMAEMGVDHVLANAGAQVDLGETFNKDDLTELLTHFVKTVDDSTGIQAIFDNSTELNIGQVAKEDFTSDTLEALFESGIGDQLLDLGIHKVVAQVEVAVLGSDSSSYESFEFDIKKPV